MDWIQVIISVFFSYFKVESFDVFKKNGYLLQYFFNICPILSSFKIWFLHATYKLLFQLAIPLKSSYTDIFLILLKSIEEKT